MAVEIPEGFMVSHGFASSNNWWYKIQVKGQTNQSGAFPNTEIWIVESIRNFYARNDFFFSPSSPIFSEYSMDYHSTI